MYLRHLTFISMHLHLKILRTSYSYALTSSAISVAFSQQIWKWKMPTNIMTTNINNKIDCSTGLFIDNFIPWMNTNRSVAIAICDLSVKFLSNFVHLITHLKAFVYHAKSKFGVLCLFKFPSLLMFVVSKILVWINRKFSYISSRSEI